MWSRAAPKWDYRTELSDTVDLVVVGAFAGRGRHGVYGALLAAYDPAADPFRTVTKCGTGFSDAELAALPARLARPVRPARVDRGQEPSVWFELGPRAGDPERRAAPVAELHRGLGRIKEDTGLALRFPRFTGRWRDDKAAEDATTTQELIDLYRTARRASAGT